MVWTCERVRGDVLGKVGEVRVGGHWPVERPRNKWSECVMEDIYELVGIKGHVVQD